MKIESSRLTTKPVNARKYQVALLLAQRLLALPRGGWPETQQAELELSEALPKNVSRDEILAAAAKTDCHIHPERLLK